MGKSALALCMAANVAVRHAIPVALFTLEMSKAEVTQRLMCAEGKVESQRLRTGKLAVDDWPRLTAACDKLAKAPIYVDDTGSITMMEIRSKLRRLKMREPELGLVIVDYLQLMTSGTSVENRVQEVSQISRALKVLARDLEVPIVALSQLSRAVEQRHDKRPILSDLREVGLDRAGRRPRDVRLPRRVLQPGGDRVGRHRRADPREAPQRRHRHREARVPEAVREVRRPGGRRMTTVWLSPSATAFSCLCEPCLEAARTSGALFADALASARVRGSIAAEAEATEARCAAGHEIVLRRVERPPALARPDDRQLQLA